MSPRTKGTRVEESDPAFEALLEYIQEQRPFDFRGYKRASLERRVRRRMQEVGIGDVEAYRDRLEEWNAKAEDLWGVRAEEGAGTSFAGLDIGLPVARLAAVLRDLGAGSPYREEVVAARNRRGRPIRCRVTGTPLADPRGSAWGRS